MQDVAPSLCQPLLLLMETTFRRLDLAAYVRLFLLLCPVSFFARVYLYFHLNYSKNLFV